MTRFPTCVPARLVDFYCVWALGLAESHIHLWGGGVKKKVIKYTSIIISTSDNRLKDA